MKISSRAVVLGAVFGLLVAPACEIHIQQGEASGHAPSGATSGAGAGGGGAASTLTPEEAADLDALQHADPIEVARVTDTAAFAAVTANNLVGLQAVDPSTLDAASAAQLIDSVAPDAISAALLWSQSVEASVFTPGIFPKHECAESPSKCPLMTSCAHLFPGTCFVTNCGKGSCKFCPEYLQNLVVEGWCAYGCMQGSEMTGGAFILQTKFALTGDPFCFPK